MKTLKKILIGIGVLIVLLLVAAIFMPKTVVITEDEEMDVPRNVVYNIVNELTTWEKWTPWKEEDPDALITMGNITTGKDANYRWESNKMGNGELFFTDVVPNERIDLSIHMEGEQIGTGYYAFADAGEQTKVTWGYEMHMGFPSNLMGPIMKWGMSSKLEEGLENLEDLAKQRYNEGKYRGFDIKDIQIDERHYILNRAEVQFANIQQFFAQNLGSLFQKAQAAGIEMDGMPSGLFFKYDQVRGLTDMAAAIPTKEAVAVQDASSLTIDEGKGLQIDYYGDYSNLQAAHTAIEEYMRDRNQFSVPPVIEEYVTDPASEPDPQKWLTKIIYKIAE